MKKTQKVHFENEQKERTACVLIVMDPRMDLLPMYYRMIQMPETGMIYCGRQKWDAWKRCTTPDQQLNFLHKHVWAYEPGKMQTHHDELFQKIMLIVEAE